MFQVPNLFNSGSRREIIVNATMISYAEIRCDLSECFKNLKFRSSYLGLEISVSNDGKRFSKSSVLYRIFDSKCTNCSNGLCSHKVN